MAIEKTLYTAHATSTGGRDGKSKSDDGKLEVKLAPPKEMGGNGEGTNPEQLFAAGWSTCFHSAIGLAARRRKVALPEGFAIDAEVDLSLQNGFYTLSARLHVTLPGLPRDVAQALVDEAHTLCPYSRATHGNIDVKTSVAA